MRRVLIALPLLLLGCGVATAPDPEIGDRTPALGTIEIGSDGPEITLMPLGNRTLRISITTYGAGCYRAGGTEADIDGLEAVVTPWDYVPPPESPCTRDLVSFEHTVNVRFRRSGTARVLVRGLSTAREPYGDTIVVERTAAVW